MAATVGSVVKTTLGLITSSLLLLFLFILFTLLRIDGHAGARDNLINVFIADNIIPRNQIGVWKMEELEVRVREMSEELTGDKQLWKSFLDEYLEWEARHTVKHNSLPLRMLSFFCCPNICVTPPRLWVMLRLTHVKSSRGRERCSSECSAKTLPS